MFSQLSTGPVHQTGSLNSTYSPSPEYIPRVSLVNSSLPSLSGLNSSLDTKDALQTHKIIFKVKFTDPKILGLFNRVRSPDLNRRTSRTCANCRTVLRDVSRQGGAGFPWIEYPGDPQRRRSRNGGKRDAWFPDTLPEPSRKGPVCPGGSRGIYINIQVLL